ncbi:hypothetical protein DERF_009041 [Dermatophagoides farinae]|uniref:Uncharacterized protein n=1 Tax=Dermatophagoides farinae TaxID=6954 RepID=A0A922L0B2_DERFA|nr:hypothetical protein DERF_009041 [Dermatophagoides farinae]
MDDLLSNVNTPSSGAVSKESILHSGSFVYDMGNMMVEIQFVSMAMVADIDAQYLNDVGFCGADF